MNIELFGFKKDGNRWVTDYSYTDNYDFNSKWC